MIVSDTSLAKLVFPKESHQDVKNWFEKGQWRSIDGKILIHPFDSKNLGPFSYDLCVGEEVYSNQKQQVICVDKRNGVSIEPGIFLVLTHEYIGLPRDFAGSVMPRFSLVREGIMQSMTKIDPTWYGRIVVAIDNRSKDTFHLRRGQAFCTLIVHRLDKPCSKILNSKDSPALGKESITYFLSAKRK